MNGDARDQTRMRNVGESSDQIWMKVLFNFVMNGDARDQTRMRNVGELSDQIWMKVLFNCVMRAVKRG